MTPDDELEKLALKYYMERPLGFGNPTDDFTAGFRACEKLMAERLPSEDEVTDEVWKRIHQYETKRPSGLPEYVIREVTADAYWSACARWLKQKLFGDHK